MNRFWFVLLALSLGFNAGLVYVQHGARSDARRFADERPLSGPPGEPRGRAPLSGPEDRRPRRGPPEPPPPEELIEHHLRRMADRLDLDAAQRRDITDVLAKVLPEIARQRQAIDRAREAVADYYGSPTFDEDTFRRLGRKLRDAQSRLDSLVTEAMLGEAALLTTEQRQRYVHEMPWSGPGGPPPRAPR